MPGKLPVVGRVTGVSQCVAPAAVSLQRAAEGMRVTMAVMPVVTAMTHVARKVQRAISVGEALAVSTGSGAACMNEH
jgi:hypothetical protein